MKRYANVIGFDDAPFQRTTTGNVTVVGAVFAGVRLDGFLRGAVRRDGANATRELARLILESRFREHLQLVLLEGKLGALVQLAPERDQLGLEPRCLIADRGIRVVCGHAGYGSSVAGRADHAARAVPGQEAARARVSGTKRMRGAEWATAGKATTSRRLARA